MSYTELSACDSVLFDLDGTLWDASSACALAWTQTLKSLGFPDRNVTATEVRGFTGLQFETILADFFPWLEPDRCEEVLDRYKQTEFELMRSQGGVLYSEVEAILRRLSQTKRLFIVSNCLEGYVENFFQRTGLELLFDGHLSLGQSGQPKAQNIASVIEDNGLESPPLYVGDTAHDAEAAMKNQIPFVFAEYGFGSLKSPRYSIRSFGELLGLFSIPPDS